MGCKNIAFGCKISSLLIAEGSLSSTWNEKQSLPKSHNSRGRNSFPAMDTVISFPLILKTVLCLAYFKQLILSFDVRSVQIWPHHEWTCICPMGYSQPEAQREVVWSTRMTMGSSPPGLLEEVREWQLCLRSKIIHYPSHPEVTKHAFAVLIGQQHGLHNHSYKTAVLLLLEFWWYLRGDYAAPLLVTFKYNFLLVVPQKFSSFPTPDKKASQKIGLRLRNLLKLPKAHKWCIYEWFYSNIDRWVLNFNCSK